MHNRIREFREAQDQTLEQLAESVGTTAQQISRLEKGQRKLTVDWMHRIAAALSVDAADLITNSGPDINEIAQKIEDRRVVQWWHMLSDDQKRMIAGFAREMGLDILADKAKKRSA